MEDKNHFLKFTAKNISFKMILIKKRFFFRKRHRKILPLSLINVEKFLVIEKKRFKKKKKKKTAEKNIKLPKV